jgi:hypothetical protein
VPQSNNRNHAQSIWQTVTTFCAARSRFNEQREHYENLVKDFARKQSVDRRQLHLDTREVASLLDFKSIEEIRDTYLHRLKSLTHAMFRRHDSTDLLDKYVSDIYHEISILKEEHYTVLTYAPAYEEGMQGDLSERDKILKEVHEFFPRKMEQIENLFQKAQSRLEELLPQFGKERVFVRSLYMFGEEATKGVYKGGLAEFYGKVYPVGGAAEGYLTVARSFQESGFPEQAVKALAAARSALKASALPDAKKKKLREEIKQLEKLTSEAPAQ